MNPDNLDDLKPCPFCGSVEVGYWNRMGYNAPDSILCAGCLMIFTQAEIVSVEDLVEAWNRRPGDES